MKKILLTVILSITLAGFTSAQVYHLECFTSPYNELTGGFSVPQDILWMQYEFAVPVGFTFQINGDAFDSLFVSDVGAIGFWNQNPVVGYLYLGFGVSLYYLGMDSSNSRIRYSTTGAAGNRIFKLEYRNCGFGNGGYEEDSVNFQIWLYESDYALETHIGPVNAAYPDEEYINGIGPAIGIVSEDTAGNFVYSYMLTGNPSSPSTTTAPDIYSMPELTGTPASGQVYRFVPEPAGKEEMTKTLSFSAYPNPNTGKCNITVPDDFLHETNLVLCIYDNTGKFIQRQNLVMDGDKVFLDLEAEAKGVYTATLSNGVKTYTGRIVFE